MAISWYVYVHARRKFKKKQREREPAQLPRGLLPRPSRGLLSFACIVKVEHRRPPLLSPWKTYVGRRRTTCVPGSAAPEGWHDPMHATWSRWPPYSCGDRVWLVLVVNPAGRPPAERCNTHHVHMHEYNASFLESLWTRETYQTGNSGRPRRGEAHQTSDGTCVYASCVYIKGRGCSLYPREQTSEWERDREIIDRSTTMARQRQVASMLAAALLVATTFASIPTSTDRVFSVTVVVVNSLIVITSLALYICRCCSIRCFICMCACKRVVLFAYINRNLNCAY